MGADTAVRVSVPEGWAEIAGAVLLDLLGPFQEFNEGGLHHMIFYPFRYGAGFVEDERILAQLPDDPVLLEAAEIERVLVPTGWEEGWKDYFKPITVGRLYIRPPWEQPPPPPSPDSGAAPGTGSDAGSAPTEGSRSATGTGPGSTEAAALLDIVLTPGLAFGTGLHPTTRGVLNLLQDEAPSGPVVDVGTGSGILAISAAKLGFGPILAFDNDPLAVTAARSNAQENGVDVRAEHGDLGEVPSAWFDDATILANLTLEPVLALISQLARGGALFRRLLVSGILSGEQEATVVAEAARSGLSVGRRLYETEWVSMDLRPLT